MRLRALRGGQSPPAPSDEQILAGLSNAEAWAAGALYDRVHAVVDRTLRRILHARDADHEDFVQITFERILRTLLEQRFSGACTLSTWASAIASHVAIDALRARVRQRRVFGHRDPEVLEEWNSGSNLEHEIEARSEIRRLHGVFANMKPEHAKTVVLHDVVGHELSEIAVIMGVSVAAAQSRLVRGRKELLRRARGFSWRNK
jgi:RNA polymerase sigma-70 factor (ECF subfamily)